MNPTVDFFFSKTTRWQSELMQLRSFVLDCPLNEDFKWGVPCYTYENSNIVLIHAFKEYCALLFINGALLKDPNRVLIQQTKHTQAARQIRFTNLQEIVDMETLIKTYIFEAIDAEKAGLKVTLKEHTEIDIPEELQTKWDEIPHLKTAFKALTPGRQRAYLIYFTNPKQYKTRLSRIEKNIQPILNGKGLNEI